jgi:hypothetical protein
LCACQPLLILHNMFLRIKVELLEGVRDEDEGQPAQDPVLPVQQAEPWTQLRFQQLLYLTTIT